MRRVKIKCSQKQNLFIRRYSFSSPVLGFSQEALTWDDCVKEASQNNKDLLTAEQTVKADEDSHVASLGQFFPQITFDASISRSGVGGFNDALTSSQYDQSSGLSLNLSQDIFSYKDFSAVDQSNAQLDLARDRINPGQIPAFPRFKGRLFISSSIPNSKSIC